MCFVGQRQKGGNAVAKKAFKIKEIEELCTSYNLVDIWRRLNPLLESYTWRKKSHKKQCRLDFCNLDATCKIFHVPETDLTVQFRCTFRPDLESNRPRPRFLEI